MPSPGVLKTEEVIQGKQFTGRYQFLDADGNPLNLAAASVDVEMRLRLSDGVTVKTRKKSAGASQFAYVNDGTDGWGAFFWDTTETASWTLGMAQIQMVYKDSGTTPATDDVWAEGWLKVLPFKTKDPAP